MECGQDLVCTDTVPACTLEMGVMQVGLPSGSHWDTWCSVAATAENTQAEKLAAASSDIIQLYTGSGKNLDDTLVAT